MKKFIPLIVMAAMAALCPAYADDADILDYVDSAVASATPADYATVSNRAMTALQSVKVNGTTLTPDANKAVDVVIPDAPVTSVNNKTGAVVLAASNVGALGNRGDQQISNGSLTVTPREQAQPVVIGALTPYLSGVYWDYVSSGLFYDRQQNRMLLRHRNADILLPAASGTLAFTSDIPTNVSTFVNDANYLVGTVTATPAATNLTINNVTLLNHTNGTVTVCGVEVLRDNTTALTNSAAFTEAVVAVSPPASGGSLDIYTNATDAASAEGWAFALTDNISVLTNTTEEISGGVTNTVTTITTNSYPVLALYRDGVRQWTSDPAEQGAGYWVALILALIVGAGGFIWRFFSKSNNVLKIDPETGAIYYETED